LGRNNPRQALADGVKAVELDANDAYGWVSRGAAYSNLNQPEKGIADLTQAIKLNPTHARAWSERGGLYNRIRQPAKAVADLTKAIELDPTLAPAWFNRGMSHHLLYEPSKTVADFTRALELKPNAPDVAHAYRFRAEALVRLGDYERAAADFESALQRGPDHPRFQELLAWFLSTCPDAKRRDPDRAVGLAKKAVDRAPGEGIYWNTLGIAHYRAGNAKAAVEAIEKGLELRKNAEAADRFFLAMAHHKLGNRDQARQAYEQAVEWLEKNTALLAADKRRADERRRFREEAEDILGLKKK
jgi:tetratricopeptide (TPR) repeat protein